MDKGDFADIAASGDMAAMVRAHDWAATPLGPLPSWPQSLRTIVSVMLASRFAMWMSWGPELAFLYNDAYAPTLGVKHGWALGRPSREVWAEIWPDIGPRIERVLATGQATWDQALMLLLERSGYAEETYHTFSYSPIRDDGGSIAGHLCVVTEETERIISERRLRTLRELGAGLAEAGTEADAIRAIERSLSNNSHDLPFTLTYLWAEADGAAQLVASTGFGPDHAAVLDRIGHTDASALWPTGPIASGEQIVVIDDLPRLLPGLPSGAWHEPSKRALAVAIARQGQDRPAGHLVFGINPHRTLDTSYTDFLRLIAGQIASALANARAYEAERRRSEALAELDRAKTAFFSNVSHEFRTPLTLLLGPLEEALEKADTAPGADLKPLIETGTRNALRLLRLVNTLLDFARIESNRVQAQLQPTDLAKLTAGLAAAFETAMDRAGLRFVIDCPPLSGPVQVDPDMWEKVVLNLLSNAFKFTFDGEVAVTLNEEGRTVVLTVRDTGTGIPEEHLHRVFERFHRIEGSRGRSHEGTGIGLALVRDLVVLHGGDIEVDSELGRGSTFRVRLPFGEAQSVAGEVIEPDTAAPRRGTAFVEEALTWLADEAQATRDTAAAEHSAVADWPTDAAPPGVPAAAGRILLADDNADMRDYVRRLLEGAGHKVFPVTDGEAALERLRLDRPDLVLTDVMMPRLDGLGLLRAIRTDATIRDVPVILLSARAGEAARVEGLETQADDYLTKPFSARELLARVNATLGITRLRQKALQEQQELTERLRGSEAALRQLNETLEVRVAERTAERDRLWESSEDLLAAMDHLGDHPGRLLRVSPSWTRLLGYRAEDLLSADYASLIHPEDAALVADRMREMRDTGAPVRFDSRTRASDGTYKWMAWSLSPDATGATVFGIGRDVTAETAARDALFQEIEERERIEDTLRQMQRLEAVGQLTSGVAHDFNNLLTVILGNLDYVSRGVNDATLQRRLSMMRSAAQRGANLTGQLLAFSRKQHLDPKPLALNDTVRGMNDLLRGTLGGTVRLEIVLKPDLWPALVDQTQLELVILNLAINARDAMPVGGALTIETGNVTLGPPRKAEEPAAGEYVMVAVTDSGTGMAPDVLERVFEPFFTTKEPGKGSGLGLAQVYGFAKQSGGGVRIETKLGEGTAVKVYLPRAGGAVGVAQQEQPAPAGPIATGQPRALVVDDDSDVREITRSMLQDLGFQVSEAGSGDAALDELARRADFDVLLIDFAMPGMNGAELARHVETRHPELPIVLITGYADTKALQEARNWPIISKPFMADQLATALRDILGRQPPASNVVPIKK